ncbi:uncharacterized protein LOC123873315 [Maniola jurtina]|uniref:uncharacterized protein LOC123873315 n=1 Tax=Maniola jurtina TaxID=191418 RepID=UPI001E68EF4A|nr:uncharacterized protein LOC123873315 [Maniola jurtina]
MCIYYLCFLQITDTDFVCQACWDLANHASEQVLEYERQVGHKSVCVGCGRSILRSRSRVVLRPDSTVEERQLADIISQWIRHCQLTPTDEACGPCWLRAQRMLRRNTGTQSAQPNLLANQVIIPELEVENPVEQEETQTIPEQ